jgi:cysteinyl-tRNA synthetase
MKDDNKENKKYLEEFEKAINDDLDTPKALSILWSLVRDEKAEGKLQVIAKMDEVLGLDLLKNEAIEIPEKIQALIEKRGESRKNKDWKLSDKIRDEIKELGFIVEDSTDGQRIKKI